VGLKVQTSKIEPDIVVVRLSGTITLDEADEVESLIDGLLKRCEKKLILELSGINRIDSVGGMVLVRCFFASREAGGLLRVAGASQSVARIFQITQVATLIQSYPSVDAACEHFPDTPRTGE
jgi:anti-anti-sigma factor